MVYVVKVREVQFVYIHFLMIVFSICLFRVGVWVGHLVWSDGFETSCHASLCVYVCVCVCTFGSEANHTL